ncbi:MAG: hypothetical protein MZU97_14880 [Bacillus subtilis]|nr:hypothetical protein [Bacillus subtilis]
MVQCIDRSSSAGSYQRSYPSPVAGKLRRCEDCWRACLGIAHRLRSGLSDLFSFNADKQLLFFLQAATRRSRNAT